MPEPALPHMSVQDLANLHQRCFPTRPWSADAFSELMQHPGSLCLTDPSGHGLLLARAVAGEAEILTVATAPACRRQGIARALVLRLFEACQIRQVGVLFLEVAADNPPAMGLYTALGFDTVGRRKGYYPRQNAPPADAVIMRRALTPSQPG